MTTEKLIVGEEGFSKQLLDDVNFDITNLDKAYMEQASLFCFYAEQSKLASKKQDNSKLKMDTTEAVVAKKVRDDAADAGVKITEKMVEEAVIRNGIYIKAIESYNDAKATAQMLRDSLEALKQRKDMLIHIGLNLRDEAKMGRMRVMESEKPHYVSEEDMKQKRESLKAKVNS